MPVLAGRLVIISMVAMTLLTALIIRVNKYTPTWISGRPSIGSQTVKGPGRGMPAHPSQFAPPFQVNKNPAMQQPYEYQMAPGKHPSFPAHPSAIQWQQQQMARPPPDTIATPTGPTLNSSHQSGPNNFPQVGSSHGGLANGHHANDLSSAGHQVSKSENVNSSSNENKNSAESEQTSIVNGVHPNSTSRPNYNIQQSTPTPVAQSNNHHPQQQYQCYPNPPEQQNFNQYPPQSFPSTSETPTYPQQGMVSPPGPPMPPGAPQNQMNQIPSAGLPVQQSLPAAPNSGAPPQQPPTSSHVSYQANMQQVSPNNRPPHHFQSPQYTPGPPMPGYPGSQPYRAPLPPNNMNPGNVRPPVGFPPMPPTSGPMNPNFPPQPPTLPQTNMGPPPAGPPPPMGPSDSMGGHPPRSPPGPPQQSRNRLDPDLMPSPITVLLEDQKNRGDEPFQTGNRMQPAGAPPLCTTMFVSVDQGNCRPQFLRSTVYSFPVTKDMCNSSRLPICMALQPYAQLDSMESPIPTADCSSTGVPIRCNRCKAYMSPLMVFVDGGRKFECLLCGCVNEVPEKYFCHLDHTGLRMDTYQRPELCVGSYEFLAPTEYCKNQTLPKEPAYIFMIDVSANAIKSGMVNLLCNKLKHVLEVLPKMIGAENREISPIRVGFATYSHVVHFYNLSKSQSRPQMQVVADVNDIFLPSLEGCLVQFTPETKQVIEKVLSQIPQQFACNAEIDPILGPVMQAGLDALKSDGRTGKLFLFHTCLPTRNAPGKLKPRDNPKLLATDKEKTILKPQNEFYPKLGVECVRAGCSVDLFLFPIAHVDIATLAEVPRLTGGEVHLYNNFQVDTDGDMLMSDLANCVQKEYAFDAMVRVRTSAGVRPCDFYGNFYMETAQDVELGALDPDKCILVELKHDDKLDENAGAHVQVALLYTSFSGERRLRIHNMSFTCCTQLSDMYKTVETDVLINWICKEGTRALLKDNPKQVKEKIIDLCANSLACYRKNCANPSSPGQLILPESMKLLPVYTNNVLKSQALFGHSDVTVDNRAYLMHLVNSMTVSATAAYFYPRLVPLHKLSSSTDQSADSSKSSSKATEEQPLNDASIIPNHVRCSADKLEDQGCFILENGLVMLLWIGQAVSPDWLQQVFGVDSWNQINTEGVARHTVPVIPNSKLNEKVLSIISTIRSQRKKYLKLFIVKQRDKLDMWFRSMLLEDEGMDSSPSYVDFLCHMHKEIRNLLN